MRKGYKFTSYFHSQSFRLSLSVIAILLPTISTFPEEYYAISSTQECGELKNKIISNNDLKRRGNNAIITWECNGCELESEIILKRAKTNVSSNILLDTLETVPVKCVSPYKTIILNQYTSLKETGINKRELSKYPITLIFDNDGTPSTMFIGRPFQNETLAAPNIIRKAGSDVFFCRGEIHSFEASLPAGVSESEAYYRWYIDGVEMTGRNDRWFDTYSRTNWNDGEHIIACDVSIGKDGKRSSKGTYQIIQLPGSDCNFSIKAIPYWGADCESDFSSADFRYNEKSQWGSFVVSPIEDYAHFYMEVINKKILTSSITNDEHVSDFQLVQKSEVDNDYAFFLLPANLKIHAKEPYMPRTVYFRIEGTNINFSMIPYIKPTASVTPDSASICERSFQDDSQLEFFMGNAIGFERDEYTCKWFYSEKIDGEYKLVTGNLEKKFVPTKIGYYKMLASDGVFDVWSKPVHVGRRSENCISVTIESTSNVNYCCKSGTLQLAAFPTGDEYSYQWKYGPISGIGLTDIKGATQNKMKASISKPGEAWFVLVSKNGESVLSHPFAIKEMPSLPSSKKIEMAAYPNTVCPGRSVELVASFGNDKDKTKNDSLEYVFEWYKATGTSTLKIDSFSSNKFEISHSDIIDKKSEYYITIKGCDGILRSAKNIKVNVNTDKGACSSGNIYVKTAGDDHNDGMTWETAYASVDKAFRSASEFKNIAEYKSKTVDIHIAAGTYFPTDEEESAYVLPNNASVLGGYIENPQTGNATAFKRNPHSPTNTEGNATILKTNLASQRIFLAKEVKNVRLSGLKFDGESILKKSSLNGRCLLIENASVRIDSCTITGFYADKSESTPLAAIALVQGNGSGNELKINNSTFVANMGGQIGSCLSIQSDANVEICNSTFTNNTTQYYGGVAILSYNASPTVNIYNSTFFDNTCPEGLGYYGRSVLRMVGGHPTFNIYACTIADRFYKEDGMLRIYNSILECAGKADIYENNYPQKPNFSDDKKNIKLDNLKFLSDFKGQEANKLQNAGGFTQVMIPTNRIGIIGKAGQPNRNATTDQRGYLRNQIASSYGAYEEDCSVAIDTLFARCDGKETKAAFTSSVTGLTEIKYQWVNNYMDIDEANGLQLDNVGIGTYWLEVNGTDKEGKETRLRSNEIRISDICSEPGVYYIKTPEHGGDDRNSGMTWNQPFATIEKAIETAGKYIEKAGKGQTISIHVAAGTYVVSPKANDICKKSPSLTIFGSYPPDASNGDSRLQQKETEDSICLTLISTKLLPKKRIKWGEIELKDILVIEK